MSGNEKVELRTYEVEGKRGTLVRSMMRRTGEPRFFPISRKLAAEIRRTGLYCGRPVEVVEA